MGKELTPLRCIKNYCTQCLGTEKTETCDAGKEYMDIEPCPLFPYRTGKEFKKRRESA